MLQVGRRSLAGPLPNAALRYRAWKGRGSLRAWVPQVSGAVSCCTLQEVAAASQAAKHLFQADDPQVTGYHRLAPSWVLWWFPIHPHLLPTASCSCPVPLPGSGGI